MDDAHPGLKAALAVRLRAGVHGRVVTPGEIRAGDEAEILAAPAAAPR